MSSDMADSLVGLKMHANNNRPISRRQTNTENQLKFVPLELLGAQTHVVSPNPGKVKGWNHKDQDDEVAGDLLLKSVNPAEFDALLLPGGVMNPDQRRM